jgi:hypothetical protein
VHGGGATMISGGGRVPDSSVRPRHDLYRCAGTSGRWCAGHGEISLVTPRSMTPLAWCRPAEIEDVPRPSRCVNRPPNRRMLCQTSRQSSLR